MIGIGIPSIQSKTPRNISISLPVRFGEVNAAAAAMFR